jgi:subtilisin family serine protease
VNTALTVGGLAVGISVLVWYLLRWWHSQQNAKTGKDWRALSPLGSGVGLGILAASCAGGLLGTIAGWIRNISNAAGDKVINGATGSNSQTLATAGVPALTAGGALIVVASFAALLAMWKKVKDTSRKPLVLGSVAGITVGMSPGVAGSVAVALIPLVNEAGNSVIGII